MLFEHNRKKTYLVKKTHLYNLFAMKTIRIPQNIFFQVRKKNIKLRFLITLLTDTLVNMHIDIDFIHKIHTIPRNVRTCLITYRKLI